MVNGLPEYGGLTSEAWAKLRTKARELHAAVGTNPRWQYIAIEAFPELLEDNRVRLPRDEVIERLTDQLVLVRRMDRAQSEALIAGRDGTWENGSDLKVDERGIVSFTAWHPQLGGYAAPCVISFSRDVQDNGFLERTMGPALGCFDVSHYHDGEFPCDKPRELHYCMVEQVLEFGALILEKQMAVEVGGTTGVPAFVHGDQLSSLCAKLAALNVENERRKAAWIVAHPTGDV